MDRLRERLAASRVCVGIDPHPGLLDAWGLPQSAAGVRTFGLTVVEELGDKVAALKPQSAFFERFGAAGIAALEEILAAARAAGAYTLLDVKRGDIGSTMAAYAAAYLKPRAPLEADAITVSPYLGPDSLAATADLAAAGGKRIFALALTSNPEGAAVQHARTAAGTVAQAVVDFARPRSDAVGVVVGATIGSALTDLGIDLGDVLVLAPGLGAQGATTADLARVFGPAAPHVLGSVSRGVLAAGPGNLLAAARGFEAGR